MLTKSLTPSKEQTPEVLPILLGLFGAIFFIYWQVPSFGLLSYDDNHLPLVPGIEKGLSLDICQFAFANHVNGLWQPLTILSFALEAQLFGFKPGMMHLTNVWLHLLNCFLCFRVVMLVTRSKNFACFCALAMAVHPSNVEVVAWITERKGLLAASFFWGSLLTFDRFVQTRDFRAYCLAIILFAASLLSKGVGAAGGLVFLLLLRSNLLFKTPERCENRFPTWRSISLLVFPFFFIGAVYAGSIAAAQQASGNIPQYADLSIDYRLSNPLGALVVYCAKALVPVHTSPLYPHYFVHQQLPLLGLIAGIVLGMYFLLRAFADNEIAFGILFFLCFISPVLQFTPIGPQSIADRYLYLPTIGILIATRSVFCKFVSNRMLSSRVILPAAAAVWLLSSLVFSVRYVRNWSDDEAFFTMMAKRVSNHPLPLNNLGLHYLRTGKFDAGSNLLAKSLVIDNNYRPVFINMASGIMRGVSFSVLDRSLKQAGFREEFRFAIFKRVIVEIIVLYGPLRHQHLGEADLFVSDFIKTYPQTSDHLTAFLSASVATYMGHKPTTDGLRAPFDTDFAKDRTGLLLNLAPESKRNLLRIRYQK